MLRRDELDRPELLLVEALASKGEIGKLFMRALVLAVDVVGGQLENPSGAGGIQGVLFGKKNFFPAAFGPRNPRNSLKAWIIDDGIDQFLDENSARVFWPFFSEHSSTSIKPGEHAYVLFEDRELRHGLWTDRVPGHEGVNFSPGERSFARDAGLSSFFSLDDDGSGEASLATDSAALESQVSSRLGKLFA